MSARKSRFDSALRGLGAFVCIATALPLLRSSQWWLRVFDFPRVQITAIGIATLAAMLSRKNSASKVDKLIIPTLGAALGTQLAQMIKYTPLVPRQVRRARSPAAGNAVSLMTVNVRMKNHHSRAFLDAVGLADPDILLLLEPNQWWTDQISELRSAYPWHIEIPQENTYGMALYSRLELVEPEVRHLFHKDVPSIRTKIRAKNGRQFWFYAVHPRPPVHANTEGNIELTGAGPRDVELIRVALEVRETEEPVLVTGDFNDVAWSHTTRRFQRLGKLLDPRVGRGFFNSYHAQHRWMRFPVDHLFHSKHFSLSKFSRGANIGSDHFPILACLSLEAAPEQKPPPAKAEDEREAVETLREESNVA